MKVDIFVKSYIRDFKLLFYSLESIKKNVVGYNKLIILIPKNDKHAFLNMNLVLPKRTKVIYVDEYGEGYLYQQVCKISAHKYSIADFILFSDSDVIFDHKINLNDFVKDCKPEILYTDWAKVGGAIIWKEPTEVFMGDTVLWEFMRRNCLVYHRSTLENIAKAYPNLENQIMSSGRFSEYNAIGAYAFKFERDKYSFINTDNWEYTEPKGTQLWGWAEKDNVNDPHPYEYKRSIDVINSVLGLSISEI